MKAAKILTTLILFAVLMGCSENSGIFEPQSGFESVKSEQRKPNHDEAVLMWKQDELSVKASTEFIVENKAAYIPLPLTQNSSYWVSFDAYTDANKLTNGYIPLVKVSVDENPIFESSDITGKSGEAIEHIHAKIDNSTFSQIVFYAALVQGDDSSPSNGEITSCSLKLTNLQVFRID